MYNNQLYTYFNKIEKRIADNQLPNSAFSLYTVRTRRLDDVDIRNSHQGD